MGIVHTTPFLGRKVNHLFLINNTLQIIFKTFCLIFSILYSTLLSTLYETTSNVKKGQKKTDTYLKKIIRSGVHHCGPLVHLTRLINLFNHINRLTLRFMGIQHHGRRHKRTLRRRLKKPGNILMIKHDIHIGNKIS